MIKYLLCVALLCTFIITGCKKDKTIERRLEGKWKAEYSVVDKNGNNKMDAEEYNLYTGNTTTYNTFNKDGSGSTIVITPTSQLEILFSWSIENGGKQIRFTQTTTTNTSTMQIERVSRKEAIFSAKGVFYSNINLSGTSTTNTNSNIGVSYSNTMVWYIYKKV